VSERVDDGEERSVVSSEQGGGERAQRMIGQGVNH